MGAGAKGGSLASGDDPKQAALDPQMPNGTSSQVIRLFMVILLIVHGDAGSVLNLPSATGKAGGGCAVGGHHGSAGSSGAGFASRGAGLCASGAESAWFAC